MSMESIRGRVVKEAAEVLQSESFDAVRLCESETNINVSDSFLAKDECGDTIILLRNNTNLAILPDPHHLLVPCGSRSEWKSRRRGH